MCSRHSVLGHGQPIITLRVHPAARKSRAGSMAIPGCGRRLLLKDVSMSPRRGICPHVGSPYRLPIRPEFARSMVCRL
jgi:hypothetical protein